MRRAIAVLLIWLMPQLAQAQSAASLVADSITIPAGGDQLIASGNVEVFFEGTRLSARRIIFDQSRDRLIMEGPIYILADDLGYGDLSCYGQTHFETPNIDALAKQGMKFTRHYSRSTVCAPSRCALMTGKHVGHAVVRGNSEFMPEGQQDARGCLHP